MRRLFLVCGLMVGLSGPVGAQDAAVTGVIRQQLDAFLADDLDLAFGFASPAIKGIFQNPEMFGAMVRNGYPMVWRPGQVTFGQTESSGDRVLQTVIITDQAGRIHALEYEMSPAGADWQINGVRLLPAPQVGA